MLEANEEVPELESQCHTSESLDTGFGLLHLPAKVLCLVVNELDRDALRECLPQHILGDETWWRRSKCLFKTACSDLRALSLTNRCFNSLIRD